MVTWCTPEAESQDAVRRVAFEDALAGPRAGRAAGVTAVALTTTHRRPDLVADAVVPDLSAVSVQVTASGLEISIVGWKRPRDHPRLSAIRTAGSAPASGLFYWGP